MAERKRWRQNGIKKKQLRQGRRRNGETAKIERDTKMERQRSGAREKEGNKMINGRRKRNRSTFDAER